MAQDSNKTATRKSITGFQWDERRLIAAQMVAEGKVTHDATAEAAGISSAALAKWKLAPEFQERVAQIVAEMAEALKKKGVRVRENRLAYLQRRIDKMHALIEARAVELNGEVAGGETGLIVRDYKGKDADVPVYRFDAALVKELREHEKQAAIEVGEWAEKRVLAGDSEEPLFRPLADALEKIYGQP